ncbi:hypothetical protein GGR50DRAFT_103831 [Xylaria sp. CBS 124048]|nr:hypothetical protein GGR50DRAFT_103831 [Xylaria sp. CBS 124048]
MEAMDVDESGPSRRLALIRAVRNLDEDSSLTLPEKIHKLWVLLTAVKYTRLHGVEESILRWLLKQMSGNTESAEHARRHPLTWTVLGHVFPKIPAQALGRSLSYLRFVSVLNKALGDLISQEAQTAAPETENGMKKAKKRKRVEDWPATLTDLRTSQGCLRTASEVFAALAILLEKATTQSGEATAEKRVGAEHVKSLFSSASDETRDITAKLLLICYNSLNINDGDRLRGQQSWIDTLATVWNLRLRSREDSAEFARYIFERASLILAKFDVQYPGQLTNHMDSMSCEIWTSQLRLFLSTYFIRPARQNFSVDKNVDVLTLALDIAQRDVVASTTIMWSIAARTPRDTSDPKSKVEHNAWINKVFEVVLEHLQPLGRDRRNEVLSRLLDIALQTQSAPDTETLCTLYRELVLDETQTDWTFLSKILACDPDVLIVAQEPGIVFDNISKASNYDAKVKDEVVTNVVLPLQDAFSKARDLAGFVTQWFRSLCAAQPVEQSIWFDPRIRKHLAAILQSSLSSTQLLKLLEGLESMPGGAGELLVVLDGICAGLTDENTIAKVDSKMISMMDQRYEDFSPAVLGLRWRIFGHLASWEASKECNRLWKNIRSDLKPILKKAPLTADETFEAFSCCYKFCLSNHIGGKYEADLTKLIASMLERLISSISSEVDLQTFRPYVDLTFNCLPKLSELPKPEDNALTNLIVKLFWHVSYKIIPPNIQPLEHVRSLIHNSDVVDEESMIDALMAPLLESLDGSEKQCGWTQPHNFNLLSILLEFPVEIWTRGRRKRIMGSWKKQKSAISSCAAKDSAYALVVLRLLVKVIQQPTFYEDMVFTDLVDVCSFMTASDTALLPLIERLIDTTIRHVLANMNEFTQSYLLNASQYAQSLKPGESKDAPGRILLLKSLVAALLSQKAANGSSERLGVEPEVFKHKLAEIVERALGDFASEFKKSSAASLNDENFNALAVFLDAAQVISSDPTPPTKVELSDDTLTQLEQTSNRLMPKNTSILWKLRSFLMKQSPDRYSTQYFTAVLDEEDHEIEAEFINGFVDAYMHGKGHSVRDELLSALMNPDKLISGSTGPILAARRLLEAYHVPTTDDTSASIQGHLDLAKLHEHLTSHLSRTSTLPHFKQISETMISLLDKHSSAMTQYNVEATLASVTEICSARGPKIQGPKVAGEIFASLFKLVALIIKRYRLRLSGHFHILLTTLRALLSVLLADPAASVPVRRNASSQHPPWLLSRLQPRHAERFARLLTLICEPSAASVARSRARSELDSATDAAKRAAGQYMYLVLEMYVKLQLEVEVSREMRKALEVGVFSVLDITSEGCRKVLNESLDAAGRAVFRALFAEYRKFGKWKGV